MKVCSVVLKKNHSKNFVYMSADIQNGYYDFDGTFAGI